jgi:NADH:ubiquinone oxidoreductase subunit 6 (subunit J)
MRRLAAIKLIISIAALVFVAKPFLGFHAFSKNFNPAFSHTILLKSFTKRKVETLQEFNEKAEAISKFLATPFLLPSILFLLSLLLTAIPGHCIALLRDLRTKRFPFARLYLDSGKLII